ncbi:SAM-dependent methyltransferase [Amycolatopsis sp. NPDC089917]|uniref:SAM-dependent methyltransferase n=1 Tax=Amycolatopsis sp. NPDC089917 TaxID=3155187 RepID=UPI00342A5744
MTSDEVRSAPRRPLPPLDYDKPNLARMKDALLGGHDHYEIDRQAVEAFLTVAPDGAVVAKEFRSWASRAIRFLAGTREVGQFLDLASGMPYVENTHQTAQRHNPDALVIYVDDDPVVQAHGLALLEDHLVHVSGADPRDPEKTLSDPVIADNLELDRPVAVLFNAVLHHIEDLDEARAVVHGYLDVLAPGSYLLLTHYYTDGAGPRGEFARKLDGLMAGIGYPTVHRSRDEIESLFDGLDLLEPGLVHLHEWWPEGPRLAPLTQLNHLSLGGVAVKP